jgi:hypothetical protein
VFARRLLVLIALLLVAAAIATALSPRDDSTATRPPDPPPGQTTVAEPATVVAAIPARSRRPQPVRARVGDFVRLEVRSAAPGSVSVGGYDRVEQSDPDTPAQFEFVAERAGRFPIRMDSGKLAGLLIVRPAR